MPTFGGHVSPGERLRRLSPHECKAWLCSHHEGRLGYQSGRGHRSVVVSYAVAGDQILVRLPDYNDIVHYAPGAEVSLDVDGGTRRRPSRNRRRDRHSRPGGERPTPADRSGGIRRGLAS